MVDDELVWLDGPPIFADDEELNVRALKIISELKLHPNQWVKIVIKDLGDFFKMPPILKKLGGEVTAKVTKEDYIIYACWKPS